MKTKDAIQKHGSVAKLATKLRITTAAIYQWGEEVPPLRRYEILEIEATEAAAGVPAASQQEKVA